MQRFVIALIGALAVSVWPTPPAAASPITFTGSGAAAGNPVAASAQFDFSDSLLTIILSNTSPSHAGADKPGSTLTGLFFDLPGNPTLMPDSAKLSAGASILQAPTCSTGLCSATTGLGGEFGYQQGGRDFPHGAGEGIASSGYLSTGLKKNIGNFNRGDAGVDLDKPGSLDGINFGIVSSAAGFNPNGGLAKDPLIQDSVTFTLDNALGLAVSDISNVSFQYGTSFDEANILGRPDTSGQPGTPPPSVPEPSGLFLFVLGLALLGLGRIAKNKLMAIHAA